MLMEPLILQLNLSWKMPTQEETITNIFVCIGLIFDDYFERN